MSRRLAWARDGADWPNRAASRFVRADGIEWHVQQAGAGPVLLLAHGTGAATHSWRGLLPLLTPHFTVIAPDLPGHGFTATPPGWRMSLPAMAHALGGLLAALGKSPVIAAGHSAGAAILARMSLDGHGGPPHASPHPLPARGGGAAERTHPTPPPLAGGGGGRGTLRAIVSLNGALLPLGGMPDFLAPAARAVASLPGLPNLFAWRADRATVTRLLRQTGSTLDRAGVDYYARLARDPAHVGGAMAMMAHWDLRPLAADLPRLQPHLTLVVGANDRTIPPADAARVRVLLPSATLVTLPGLGHLAHEEDPAAVAAIIETAAR